MRKIRAILRILFSNHFLVATQKRVRGKIWYDTTMFLPDAMKVFRTIKDDYEADEAVEEVKIMLNTQI